MEENITIDKLNKPEKLVRDGVSIWGSMKLVFLLIFYETLFTFLGMGMNSIFKNAMGVSMEENLLSSIFQVFAYFFFIKQIAVKREYEIKGKGRWDFLDMGFLLMLLIGYIFVYDNTLGNLVSQTFQEKDVLETLNNLVNSKIVGFVALLMIAPIFEEIICRGIILEQLRRRYNAPIAILVSSLFFGLIHLNFNQGVNAFFIGVIFGIAYVKTNSLIPAILLHFTNNGIYYVLSFVDGIGIRMPVWGYILSGVVLAIIGLTGFFVRNAKRIKPVNNIERAEDMEHTENIELMENAETVKTESSFKTAAYGVLNVKVFGAELFSYSVFWKLVFATLIMSLVSNLLNGFVKTGSNSSGYVFFALLILVVLSFDWVLEKLSINRSSAHYFIFILAVIVGTSIASFGAKGLLMQLWSPVLEGIGLTILGAVGVILTGRKAEREFKAKLAE